MLGITLSERKIKESVRQTIKLTDVVEIEAQLKWFYAGHVARGNKKSLNKKIIN